MGGARCHILGKSKLCILSIQMEILFSSGMSIN